MNIYHLARPERIKREENAALVVIAETELRARIRAAQLCGPEGEAAWLERATCDLIGTALPHYTDDTLFAVIDCLEA